MTTNETDNPATSQIVDDIVHNSFNMMAKSMDDVIWAYLNETGIPTNELRQDYVIDEYPAILSGSVDTVGEDYKYSIKQEFVLRKKTDEERQKEKNDVPTS